MEPSLNEAYTSPDQSSTESCDYENVTQISNLPQAEYTWTNFVGRHCRR